MLQGGEEDPVEAGGVGGADPGDVGEPGLDGVIPLRERVCRGGAAVADGMASVYFGGRQAGGRADGAEERKGR